jgi:hypothetical protein
MLSEIVKLSGVASGEQGASQLTPD